MLKIISILCVMLAATMAKENMPTAFSIDIDGARVGVWTMDFPAAQKLAAEKNLPLLLNFTGSDWCGWCKKMEQQVFTQEEWQQFATANVVLVYLDYPMNKTLLPEKYASTNAALRERFDIRGLPTYIILAPDAITELGKLGAAPDMTANRFIQQFQAFIELPKLIAKLTGKDREEYDAAQQALRDFRQTTAAAVKNLHASATKTFQEYEKQITAAENSATAILAAVRPTPPAPIVATQSPLKKVEAGMPLPMVDGAQLGVWTMDFAAAKILAAEKNCAILLAFIGSDWCHWCARDYHNVFKQSVWQEFAAKNAVLVAIDFPRDKTTLPEKYVSRNEELARQFALSGFPLYLVLTPNGEKIGSIKVTADEPLTAANFILAYQQLAEISQLRAQLTAEKRAQYEATIAKIATLKNELATAQANFAQEQAQKFREINHRTVALENAITAIINRMRPAAMNIK